MRYIRHRLSLVFRYYGATLNNFRAEFASMNVYECRQWRSYSDKINFQPLVKCNELPSLETLKLLSCFDEQAQSDTLDVATFATVCEKLCAIVPTLDDNQLQNLCHSIYLIRRNQYVDKKLDCWSDLVYSIDSTFTERATGWTNHEFIEFFKCFSYLPMPRRSQFASYIMKRRMRTISRENPSTVVEFLNLMNKTDMWHFYYVPKYYLESFLNKHLSDLDMKQIGIALRAVHKLRLVFNIPGSKQKLVERMLENLSIMTDNDAAIFIYFMKFVQLQSTHTDHSFVEVISRVVNHLKLVDLSIEFYIEAGNLCKWLSFYDSQFFDVLCSKFIRQWPDLSCRQCTDVIDSLTFFDTENRFVDELERCVEDESFFNHIFASPTLVPATVKYLTRTNVYPYRIIDRMFSDEFLQQTYGRELKRYLIRYKHVLGEELLTVDGGLEIERADYNGNRLNPDVRQNINKYFCWTLPELLTSKNVDEEQHEEIYNKARWSTKVTYHTKSALDCLFNNEKLSHVCYLLQHLHRPNVLFGLNSNGTPVELPNLILNSLVVNRNMLDDSTTWFTCAIKKRNLARMEDTLMMDEITKVRQLIKLRYEVILLPWDWLKKNDDERKSCLSSCIEEKLNGMRGES